jgi:hypothetical protein
MKPQTVYLSDDTIQCTDWKTNTIYCYTLTRQHTWAFKDENVLREPMGIALDKQRNVYVAGKGTNNVVYFHLMVSLSKAIPIGSRKTFSSLKAHVCCPVKV